MSNINTANFEDPEYMEGILRGLQRRVTELALEEAQKGPNIDKQTVEHLKSFNLNAKSAFQSIQALKMKTGGIGAPLQATKPLNEDDKCECDDCDDTNGLSLIEGDLHAKSNLIQELDGAILELQSIIPPAETNNTEFIPTQYRNNLNIKD